MSLKLKVRLFQSILLSELQAQLRGPTTPAQDAALHTLTILATVIHEADNAGVFDEDDSSLEKAAAYVERLS